MNSLEFEDSEGWQTLDFAVFFCHFASQVTKSSSADALDSPRRVAIRNDPLASKIAAATGRSIHSLEAAGKVLFSHSFALIQICLQGILTHRWIGADVVDIEMSVLPACADLVRLTSEICLGKDSF